MKEPYCPSSCGADIAETSYFVAKEKYTQGAGLAPGKGPLAHSCKFLCLTGMGRIVPHGTELRSSKEQQARHVSPKQQTDGDREGTVQGTQIESRQDGDEEIL